MRLVRLANLGKLNPSIGRQGYRLFHTRSIKKLTELERDRVEKEQLKNAGGEPRKIKNILSKFRAIRLLVDESNLPIDKLNGLPNKEKAEDLEELLLSAKTYPLNKMTPAEVCKLFKAIRATNIGEKKALNEWIEYIIGARLLSRIKEKDCELLNMQHAGQEAANFIGILLNDLEKSNTLDLSRLTNLVDRIVTRILNAKLDENGCFVAYYPDFREVLQHSLRKLAKFGAYPGIDILKRMIGNTYSAITSNNNILLRIVSNSGPIIDQETKDFVAQSIATAYENNDRSYIGALLGSLIEAGCGVNTTLNKEIKENPKTEEKYGLVHDYFEFELREAKIPIEKLRSHIAEQGLWKFNTTLKQEYEIIEENLTRKGDELKEDGHKQLADAFFKELIAWKEEHLYCFKEEDAKTGDDQTTNNTTLNQ